MRQIVFAIGVLAIHSLPTSSPLASSVWVPVVTRVQRSELIVVGYVRGNEENKHLQRSYKSGGRYDDDGREYNQRWLHEASFVVVDVLKGRPEYTTTEKDSHGETIRSIRVLHDGFMQNSRGSTSMSSADDRIEADDEGIWFLKPGEVPGTYRRETAMRSGDDDIAYVRRCLEALDTNYAGWTPGIPPDDKTWVTTWGCHGRTIAHAILQADGDVTLSGISRGDLMISGRRVMTSPEWERFITRVAPTGTPRWTQSLGCGRQFSPQPYSGPGISTLLVGDMNEACSILGTRAPWSGKPAKLIVCITEQPKVSWMQALNGEISGLTVIATPSGEVAVVGSFKGKLNCAGKAIVAKDGTDWFVGTLDAKGSPRDFRVIERAGEQSVRRAVRGPRGEVVVAGSISTIQTGPHPRKTSDVIIASLSSQGAVQWADTIGGQWDDWASDVAVGSTGLVVATLVVTPDDVKSFMRSALDANARAYPARSHKMLYAWSADGDRRWSVASAGDDVEFGADGRIYTVGWYGDDVYEWSRSDLPASAGDRDIFIDCYDDEGKRLWARRDGGLGAEAPTSFCVLPGPRALIAGSFDGLSFLAGHALKPVGWLDVFMMNIPLSSK